MITPSELYREEIVRRYNRSQQFKDDMDKYVDTKEATTTQFYKSHLFEYYLNEWCRTKPHMTPQDFERLMKLSGEALFLVIQHLNM